MKKMTFVFVVAAILCGMICSCTNGVSEKETKKSLMIEVPVPERPAGQKDVVNLVTSKLDTVRVGFIGLGMRGPGAVERFLHIPGTKVVALCDIRPEQVEKCQGILKKAGVPEAVGYSGSEDAWKQLCEREDINLVYIATDWLHHAPMALYAMEHGKHVAIEVPAAMNMEEIWALINMAEKKQLHCMMLENCVYDFFELTTLNMAQQGVFGEVLHVEGAYIHNLEEFWPYYWNNWRMDVKKALMEKYKHPIQIELEEQAKKVGGHGGMDFIMDYRLVYCLRNGLPLDMDVYDLAEWCCLGELTALSLENNSAPVAIPDFTRGGWNKTKGYRHAMVK